MKIVNTKLCRYPNLKLSWKSSCVPPLLQKIYSHRGVSEFNKLKYKIQCLRPYYELSNIYNACRILKNAISKNSNIIVVGDFDVDGATGTALAILALRNMGAKNVSFLLPNRFKDDYGLTPKLVEQASFLGADLIITIDNGISSYDGVNQANQKGIKVLITDHHLPNAKLPLAESIINPNLNHNCFLRSLSGVGVVFYLMSALQIYLKKCGINFSYDINKLLDLVALGTIADIVPLDINNRILVWQGLIRMRSGQCRPGIRALIESTKCNINSLVVNDLSFILCPRLNAAGRLKDMSISVQLLLTENFKEARMIASELNNLNKERKTIEISMQSEALSLCESINNKKKLPLGLTLYKPHWHQGVIGILASRLKNKFNRPIIVFTRVDYGLLKGSGRSIDGINIKNILEEIHTLNPGLILKFGGHAAAVGLTINSSEVSEFCKYFSNIVSKYIKVSELTSVIWSDGELPTNQITLATAKLLRNAGPWGHGFSEPIFDGKFYLLKQKIFSDRHLEVIIKTVDNGSILKGILFDIDTTIWPNYNIKRVHLAYKLDINNFQDNEGLQLIIEHIWPL